jgi:hypothetical protein
MRRPNLSFASAALCAVMAFTVVAAPVPADFEARWTAAETTMAAAAKAAPGTIAGVYLSAYGERLHLSPDGKAAAHYGFGDDDDAESAMTGTYIHDGNWLVLSLDGHAFNPATAPTSFVDALIDSLLENVAGLFGRDEDSDIGEYADFHGHGIDPDMARRRLLLVPYAGGHLLIDESMLEYAASSRNGDGELRLHATYAKLPDGSVSDESEYVLDDLDQANLPAELARMLSRETIEATAIERLTDAADLAWQAHRAAVRFRVDRGELHGLYNGMRLHGRAPFEHIFARVVELEAGHAVAEWHIERFHPDDLVELPPPGMRLASRGLPNQGCGLDFSVAVRARVLSTTTGSEGPDYDSDGFAWFELDVDHGAMQGLAIGDTLSAEDDWGMGEGRVQSVRSNEATVLWRVRRYGAQHQVDLPKRGQWLVTPAWRSQSHDMFGGNALSAIDAD